MALILGFGKYRGVSLEEIALGKSCPIGSGKSEGYYYFHQLGRGDEKYFGGFQKNPRYMTRWNEIHEILNNFKPVYKCGMCKIKTPAVVSIAGSGKYGYSMGTSYIACDNRDCRRSLISMPSGDTMLYPLGFDTILDFGWSAGGKKFDEKQVLRLMLRLVGWKSGTRITANSATEFIDDLELR